MKKLTDEERIKRKKESIKRYEENHKEEIIKRQREYYNSHRDKFKELHKKYHEAHREEINANQRKYSRENWDKVYASQTKYRLAHKEKIAKQCIASRKRRIERMKAEGIVNVYRVLNHHEEPIYGAKNE